MKPLPRYSRVRKRFNRSFDEDPSGCWLWHKTLNSEGYGQFTISRTHYPAHRIAWWFFKGEEIPSHLVAHHTCGVKNCVNPAHLELLTRDAHVARHMTDAL